jgi:hypothetical protein
MRRDVRDLIRRAERQGWRAELRQSGRILFHSPDGTTIVTFHGAPSDRNWHHAAVRELKKEDSIRADDERGYGTLDGDRGNR